MQADTTPIELTWQMPSQRRTSIILINSSLNDNYYQGDLTKAMIHEDLYSHGILKAAKVYSDIYSYHVYKHDDKHLFFDDLIENCRLNQLVESQPLGTVFWKSNLIDDAGLSLERENNFFLDRQTETLLPIREQISELNRIERKNNLLKGFRELNSIHSLQNDIKVKVESTINEISKIDFIKFSAELSSENSINFNLILNSKNKSLLILTVFFINDELADGYVLYTLFEGETCLVNNAKPIQVIIKGIEEYISS